MYYASIAINFNFFFLLSGLLGGPTNLARGLLGRHGPHKPKRGRAWAYKVARGPARHGPPTWLGQCRPAQDGPGPGRLFGHL
jgi:hypothetical protein